MRIVDWHGSLYYQYRHYTQRFGQNTDFGEAALAIDQWIRTGPKPDLLAGGTRTVVCISPQLTDLQRVMS
jgi:hypothetical protein